MSVKGIAARKTERLLEARHNTVLGWVRKEVEGKALKPVSACECQWRKADEMGAELQSQSQGHLLSKRLWGCDIQIPIWQSPPPRVGTPDPS